MKYMQTKRNFKTEYETLIEDIETTGEIDEVLGTIN